MRLHRILGLALLAAALPAIAAAQKTTYDFDKSAPFAQFRTYSMKDGTPTKNELIDKRIVAAIEAQLAAKGFTKKRRRARRRRAVPRGVRRAEGHLVVQLRPDVRGGYGYGWGGGWGTTTTDVRVREILVGTLAIDMVDAKKKQMAWRGLGTKEIDTNAKPEKRDENINKAVEKIFKNYPPKVKT